MKILVISDIHGNAEALKAVMQAEQDRDATIFLGDSALSGPQANETLELLQHIGPMTAIMGNHDHEVMDPSSFANWPPEWIALNEWILERLDPSGRDFIAGFLPAGEYQVGELKAFMHHGEMGRGRPAALPDAEDQVFEDLSAGSTAPLILFGHTHVQFSRVVGERRFINPGSVGQPRCGKLHACYGVFEDGVYDPRQVTYDPAPWLAALARIEGIQPYPEFCEWLRNGLLTGYGIGERGPWTQFAAQGYC